MTQRPEPDFLFSGGGISFLTGNKRGRFSYGYSSFKGKRASMEDFFETRISEVDGQMVAFFGVFDGHGGSRAAEYLKNNLFNNLIKHPDFIRNTKSAIVEAFKQTDTDYINEEIGQQKDAGSTASTAFLMGDRLLVANVGDSRVVACRAGSGTWRVGGVLAVSRAFGDKLLKQYVVAEPEIQEEEIEGVEFLIIASDGLWNVVSNKDAVDLVYAISDAEASAKKLIEAAYARGSTDNITCVVVRFENSNKRGLGGGKRRWSVPNSYVRTELKDPEQIRKQRQQKAGRISHLRDKSAMGKQLGKKRKGSRGKAPDSGR